MKQNSFTVVSLGAHTVAYLTVVLQLGNNQIKIDIPDFDLVDIWQLILFW